MRERRSTRRGGRRAAGSTIDTIYWRGIPAQLTARVAGEQEKLLLHARFQHAIDRAAGVAGLTATDDYVNEWRVEPEPIDAGQLDPGTGVATLLEQRCAAIEAAYPRERLEALVAAGGLDERHDSPQTTDGTEDPT